MKVNSGSEPKQAESRQSRIKSQPSVGSVTRDSNRKISTLMMKINPSPSKKATGHRPEEQQVCNPHLSLILEDTARDNDPAQISRSNTAIWRKETEPHSAQEQRKPNGTENKARNVDNFNLMNKYILNQREVSEMQRTRTSAQSAQDDSDIHQEPSRHFA